MLPALAVFAAACSGGDDPTVAEAKYQKDLAAAADQARGHLSYFWEHFEAPQVDEYDFALKVALPRLDGQEGAEDAWVQNIARGDGDPAGDLAGELMVDPKYLGELREGAIVHFQEKQVTDWAFLRGEELIGHYTTRVMLPRMDAEQAEGLKSMFGENPP
jgi:uncharacterized protein YegJ (DUF2314 family)